MQMELGWLFSEKNGEPFDDQHYVQDAPRTRKEPRKTKDETRGRLRWFPKTCNRVAQKVVQ